MGFLDWLRDDTTRAAGEHGLYRGLPYEPNPEMTSFMFYETLMTHLLLWERRSLK